MNNDAKDISALFGLKQIHVSRLWRKNLFGNKYSRLSI